MRKFLLILVFGFPVFHVTAQEWEKTNGPYGGDIRDLIVHPSGTLYALGDNPNRAMFRSTDNGNTWVEHAPSVMQTERDAHRIADLYVAGDGTIYALGDDNLYKTADNGTTWIKINTVSGANNGGFEGAAEFAINRLSGNFYVMGYHYNDGKNTVYRSSNNGATWTKGYQGTYLTNVVCNDIGDLYGLSGGGTWKSSDDGTTFVQLDASAPADVRVSASSITVKSDGSQIAISTTNSTMYTLTQPATWAAVTESGIEDINYGFNSILLYSADNSTLFLFDNSFNKVYSRTTGAWTRKTATFLTAPGYDIKFAVSRDINNLYVAAPRIGIYKSINGGIGWTEANTGIENLPMSSVVAADNGDVIAAGLFAFRSTDDGQSWSKISTTDTEYFVMKAATGTPKTLLLLAIGGGVSYKSVNNGASWTTIADTPNNAARFASPDGTKIVACTSNALYYSGNQGVTWSSALTISGLSANPFFAVFSDLNTIVMDQNANIFAYVFESGFGYRVFKIVPNSTTTPTSAVATEIPFSTLGISSLRDMRFMNNKVYMSGSGSSGDLITVSADGGGSWTQKSIENAGRMDMDPVNNYIFMTDNNSEVAYTIRLLRTLDASVVTSSIEVPTDHTIPYGIAVNPDGYAYAGFSGSSIFKTKTTVVTPGTPTNLVSAGNGTDRLMLRWTDNASNEQFYFVEKFDGSTYDSVARVSSSFSTGDFVYAEIRNLEPNTSHQFKVYAKNAAGQSGELTLTASTLQECESTIPDNRSWNGNVNGTATLTNVLVKSIGDGLYSISDVNNNTVTETTVEPGIISVGCEGAATQTYFTPTYPLVPDGNGTWNSTTNTLVIKWHTEPWMSTQIAGTVTLVKNSVDPTPSAPANVGAYVYNDNSIEVNWNSVAFEKTFTIERKTGVSGVYDVVGTVEFPNTSFIDPGPFTIDQVYVYRVKSANANVTPGVSAYSNEAQVTFRKPNLILAQTTVNDTPINSLGTLWADFNNDGFDDLVFTHFDFFTFGQSKPDFFQNDGTGDFAPINTNLDLSSYASGTAADYDNDGNIDLFYSTFGDANRLYKGNGSFTFSKVSPSSLEGESDDSFEGAPFTASWVDFDNDGLLDLFMGRSGSFTSEMHKQNPDHSFTKVTTPGELVTSPHRNFAMAWGDYDNDRDQDVFVIDQNENVANKLFRNNNDGTFTKITGSVFDADAALDGQCVSWADFDNDQDLDLFVGEAAGTNLLYRNNGNGTFTKLTTAGFDVTGTPALGSNWQDFNNDGFIDLLVVGQTGNTLYMNVNGTSFTKTLGEKITDNKLFCIAPSSSDFDNDGFMDIALSRTSLQGEGDIGAAQNSLLFVNNNVSGNWLKIKLEGTTSNRSAIGARIKVVTGSKSQIREVSAHIGLASQNSLIQHFGLGAAAKADNIVVMWPSGITQTINNINANATIAIKEDGAGPAISARVPGLAATAVAITTVISITLDEASTVVAGKLLKVAKSSTPATILHSLDVSAAAVSGNTYTFTIPAPLEYTTSYTVILDAGAFKDAFANESLAIDAGT